MATGQFSSKAALSCAGKLILGGEALSSHDLLEWIKISPDAEVINEYGPTEATVGCVIYRTSTSALGNGSVPIGRPIANAAIYLLDLESRWIWRPRVFKDQSRNPVKQSGYGYI